MEMTKKRLKKLKKGEVSDIGECGSEMEMLKDENILEKEAVNVQRGQDNTKKTNKKKNRVNLEGKDVEKEAEVDKNVVVEKAHKKKKNKEKDNKNGGSEDVSQATGDRTQNVEIVDRGQELDGGLVDKAEKKKKKKEKDNKKKSDFDYQLLEQGLQDEKIAETEKVVKKKRKRENKKNEVDATQQLENTSTKGLETDVAVDKNVMKKSRKKQRNRDQGKETDGSGSNQVNANSTVNDKGNGHKRKKPNSLENGSQDAKPRKQKKNVRFSDHVEVFSLSDHDDVAYDKNVMKKPKKSQRRIYGPDDKLVRGKRFSPEEDELVKKAVYDYIEAHNLGDEGLNMVLNCRVHREARKCWNEIALAIPHRPKEAIYFRAHNLLRRSVKRQKWTEEELEKIKEHQKKYGNNWKPLADELQRHRVHVKDAWRRIKLSNRKNGPWHQDEYQALFDLVNLDMKLRLKEDKKSKHGMLRDNISFTAISDKLATRSDCLCCMKWYNQLTSSMVSEGEWSDSDDYRLIIALYELDASCIEDVDWDSLIEHRSGDLCRKRWNQMALHIGYYGTRSFSEQVDVLGKRYCPDLMEVREEWDNKPIVD